MEHGQKRVIAVVEKDTAAKKRKSDDIRVWANERKDLLRVMREVQQRAWTVIMKSNTGATSIRIVRVNGCSVLVKRLIPDGSNRLVRLTCRPREPNGWVFVTKTPEFWFSFLPLSVAFIDRRTVEECRARLQAELFCVLPHMCWDVWNVVASFL